MKTFLVKKDTPLAEKVMKYIDWKYKGTRYVCCIAVVNCAIKVVTCCNKKDHYPVTLRNKYRKFSVRGEWVNQYQMNDLWSFNNDRVRSLHKLVYDKETL